MVLQWKYSFILMYAYSFQIRNIFSPIGMFYNILLEINWYLVLSLRKHDT